ncbi:nucleotidyltransferase domain-containing protein [Paenibacillus spongiae]|uniref:Nucleotidyltransferase family protein n=1 Tax=Paenibacillus spongiae TaxID=2909671 RepID=A0ABY5S8F9_9BACL|nr:nucleotidyltransferase family protein [Paenibacillus spongiae]UVI29112.1 nucleotidyltransferase family protein [Paenibacillus spongiae]
MDNDCTLDLRAFPEELNIMLAFLRTGADPQAQQSDKPSLPNIDWNQFLALVRHHRVYPQLYATMKTSELIPADVLQALHRDFVQNTFQMLRLSGEMERVCRTFQENGVLPLVLKGPVLAQDLYGDLSLRTSKDLDILIPIADVETVENMLLQLGYNSDKSVPRVFNWKWKVHHISFTHPQTRIQLEIHWRLNSDMGKEPPFEELWKRRRRSPLSKHDVFLLGSEDLFMYLVSHGARHGWFRLRWLADIDRMARRNLNWGMLIPLMRRYRCLHLGGQALTLASGLFRTPIPHEAGPMLLGAHQRELAQRSLYFIRDMVSFAPGSKELDRTYKRYLFALKTKRQKSVYLISQLYPSFRDTEALPLPKALHFLYFPLRPFVWLWRQVRQEI